MKQIIKILIFLFIFSIIFSILASAEDTWIFEINGQKYYWSEFIKNYYLYIESTVPKEKWKEYKKNKRLMKAYLENFINECLLMQQIKKEKFIEKNQRIIYDQTIKIIVQLYLKKEFYEKIPEPTDQEIEKFYDSHPNLFKNVDIDVAVDKIKQYLKMEKYNEKVKDYLQEKKESIRIIRNKDFFERGKKVSWVLKIGDKIVKYDDFVSLFNAYLANMPKEQLRRTGRSILLAQFTDQYINNYLIYEDVKKTDFEKKHRAEIEFFRKKMIIQYYVSIKLKGKFTPVSREQVEAYYMQNKSQFAKYTPEQAMALISRKLNYQLFEILVKDLVQTFRDESIIKRNRKFLRKKGLA